MLKAHRARIYAYHSSSENPRSTLLERESMLNIPRARIHAQRSSSENLCSMLLERETLLNTPRVKILMQIKRNPSLKWPRPIRQNAFRAKHKRCAFHHDHGHDTEGCKDLKVRKKTS
ncbi:hypothetical protein CCACVL1_30569 [Corchorus capsularis]|uniref:Uncharacterized protein n=1 Tax=Corchorus capsularis TaxID=210143 RepID=A0A1R3FWW2_COCAP|nr:hypothetical protein CCACVL1_30569 [Corchorus capsularis]